MAKNTVKDTTSNITKDITGDVKPFENTTFILGSFLIDTKNKTVSNREYWEEDEIVDGHLIHSNYEGYKVDTFINPQSTSLYIFDYYFGFKEYYKKYFNQPPFKRTHHETHHEIEGYSYINGLYEKEGKFYHLIKRNPTQFEEIEMPKGIDFSKFTYVKGNPYGNSYGYLYNDTIGLYFFEIFGFFKGLTKLASANKDNARPVVRQFFCEYNGEIFLHKATIGRVDQLTKFDLTGYNRRNIWLTNGKKVFSTYHKRGIELAGMDKWIQLTYENNFGIIDDCIYIPASKEHQRVSNKILFASPDSFILMDTYDPRKEPLKIKNVFVKHLNNYEPINIAEYQLYTNGFYIYRGQIYYNNFLIKNEFDMPNLKWLDKSGYAYDEWLCDGKLLTHKHLLESNKQEPTEFQFLSVPVADIRNLKFVNNNILVDGINFYEFTHYGISVIPLEKLWFDVKIDLSESKSAYE